MVLFIAGVNEALMPDEEVAAGKGLGTDVANEWLLLGVGTDVSLEMLLHAVLAPELNEYRTRQPRWLAERLTSLAKSRWQ